MNPTVQPTSSSAVATADTPRPSRLQVAVALAVLCRDNGIDWPQKVQFSDPYPQQLQLYTSTVAQMRALADTVGARVQPTTYTTGEGGKYAHHHARGGWLGYQVSVTCLEAMPGEPAPVDADTSAAIDDLAATVVTK